MKFLRYTINDDVWNVYLTDEDDHVIYEGGENSEAEMAFDKREIYFRINTFTLEIVLHEIWHANIGYCFLSSTHISHEDMEEISADMFAARGEHILKQGNELYKRLLELKDRKEEQDEE